MQNQEFAAILSYVPWVIFGIMAFLVLIGALKGLRRGIQRQTVRSVTIILSVVLCVIAVKIGYGRIFGYLDGITVEGLVAKGVELGLLDPSTDLSILSNLEMSTVEYILAIPLTLIVAPLCFTVLFIVISAIMLIVHGIVSGILGFKKKKNNGMTRLLGMALGAVQGLLVAAIVMLPFVGISSVARDAMNTLRANEKATESEQELVASYDANVKPITECASMNVMGICGGNIIYNLVATTSVDGVSFNMRNEVDTVLSVYSEYTSLEGIEWQQLKDEDKQAIESMLKTIEESDYFAPLLASVARSVSKTITEGGALDEMEEPMKTLFNDVFAIFGTATKDNFFTDIDTILDLYYLFSDEGILAELTAGDGDEAPPTDEPEGENDADIMALLGKKDASGKTVIARAIALLQDNPRTAPIVTSLMKLSLSMMVSGSGSTGGDIAGDTGLTSEEIEAVYDNVKQGLNDVVQIKKEDYASDEAYKSAVSESLDKTFKENDIELDPEIIDVVADHVIENFGDVEEVTDEHIVEVVLEYYDAYLNGDFDDVIGGEGDIDPDDLSGIIGG